MAIKPINEVPVDLSEAVLVMLHQKPAVRLERGPDGVMVPVPKVRDGVAGTEVELLVTFPSVEDKSMLRLTIYGPVPAIPDFSAVRLVGPVVAAPWAIVSGGKAKSGLWFLAEGIEAVEAGKSAARRADGAA